MKKFKLSLSLLAAVLGLTASFAFKAPAPVNHGKFAVAWFLYNGGPANQASSYNKTSGTPSCNGNGALCAIRGEEDGTTGHPMASVLTDPDTERRKFN